MDWTIGVPIRGRLLSGSAGGDEKVETLNDEVTNGLTTCCWGELLPNWTGEIEDTSADSSFSLTAGGGDALSGRSLILIIIFDMRFGPEIPGFIVPPKMLPTPSSSEFTIMIIIIRLFYSF